MKLEFSASPTAHARALQAGGPDAYGRPAERTVSDGGGNPCRHCLREIPAGAGMLIAAYRPFGAAQPYAETGPIFLCEAPCERYRDETGRLPPLFARRAHLLVRGYDAAERIVYGTGRVVAVADCEAAVTETLAAPRVAFVHLRSATNNCYQARAGRAEG